MEKNILLTLEYDGSCFHGWQEQPREKTVQGTLQEALEVVLGSAVKVAGTSRTDAGVHALGQCCSFKTEAGIPVERLPLAVNNVLCGGRNGAGSKVGVIRVLSAREMPSDFHARFDCKGKTYKYLLSEEEPRAFSRNYCYYIEGDLSVEAMRKAAEVIVGTHDFAGFQSAGGNPRESTVRTIESIDIKRRGKQVIVAVTGDGFLYNMVRIIVGTLVEVGLGKKSCESVKDAVEKSDRSLAGHTAPAEGLYLAEIYFK